MISENIYQTIYDEVSQFINLEWSNLIVYLEYGESSYSISFYVKSSDKYVNCYDLPNVSEKLLFEAFSRIDALVHEERKNEKGSLWTNMTMIVSSSGDFHVDFDYTDLSECSYKHKKEWKSKYLI